ncbi:MAG: phosphoribosyltransferase family protein [Chloroflexi bacterium]|nr:phosphoribosyltransferase family protein [Chloroflexota bacterium]
MLMRPEDSGPPRLISWDEVDELIDGLIPRIQLLGPFGAMVMITRGGVIPGGLLAEALSIQHLLTASVDFVAASRASMMAWPSFLQFPDPDLLRGRRTLVVDDVWGSGRTSIAVRDRVGAAGGSPISCVLHFHPYRSLFSDTKPDLYGDVTDGYVIYPWEIDRGLLGRDYADAPPQN